jgi:hypothetical protein
MPKGSRSSAPLSSPQPHPRAPSSRSGSSAQDAAPPEQLAGHHRPRVAPKSLPVCASSFFLADAMLCGAEASCYWSRAGATTTLSSDERHRSLPRCPSSTLSPPTQPSGELLCLTPCWGHALRLPRACAASLAPPRATMSRRRPCHSPVVAAVTERLCARWHTHASGCRVPPCWAGRANLAAGPSGHPTALGRNRGRVLCRPGICFLSLLNTRKQFKVQKFVENTILLGKM